MLPFKTRTYGKWILVGEHSVLRGCPALAFPLMSRFLELEYTPGPAALEVEFLGPHGAELKLLFYGVIENAMSRLKVDEPLRGRFALTSGLPVGAGLGASAALCGAVARWCEAQHWIAGAEVYDFARHLEDLFHGESSGVDLAVSLHGRGIRFVRGQGLQPLTLGWWPQFYLSYSGQRGMTAECVAKVKRLFTTDLPRAEAIDLQMREAVEAAGRALTLDYAAGWKELKHALKLGADCFEQWDLAGGGVMKHMHLLESKGATAVKPTGSGGGGFVLSLWSEDPPPDLAKTMVRVTEPLIEN